MTAKDFRIKCPMCSGIIIVDARTGHVIRHHEPGTERKDDEPPDPALFDSALGKVKKTKEEGGAMFDDAFKKVQDRNKGLDKIFRDAKKKAEEKGDQIDPKDRPEFWD